MTKRTAERSEDGSVGPQPIRSLARVFVLLDRTLTATMMAETTAGKQLRSGFGGTIAPLCEQMHRLFLDAIKRTAHASWRSKAPTE